MKAAINPCFREMILDWSCKVYFLLGGYGSGKSHALALKIILKLLLECRLCLVVREVFETHRESTYSLFAEIIGRLNLERVITLTRSPMQIIFSNGSRIIFRGLDKPEKLKSINNVSLIWIEECSEIKYSGYKELLGRLRHPTLPLFILLSTNPVARSNWTYKHFFEQSHVDDEQLYRERCLKIGGTFYHHSTADDNVFLPGNYLEQLDEMKNYDADLYRIARLGRFGVNGLRVLPQFEVAAHEDVMNLVADIPSRCHFTGLDFGFVESYNAVIRCAVNVKNKWLYIYFEYYKRGLTDDEFADELERLGFKDSREVIRCDSAEPKAIRYLQKRGFRAIAAHKWNGGTRHARLDNTKKIKRFKRIICSDACPNAIRELGELTYARDRNGDLLEDEFNLDAHTFSALWYALDSYDVTDIKRISRGDFGL